MQDNLNALIEKYNVAAPRYTSYPTVPYWNDEGFSKSGWIQALKSRFDRNPEQGISVYIHLPFCESLCTYCGCNTRITRNHQVEQPYIKALLKEWEMYKATLGTQTLQIHEIHLGGGTPTFFAPEHLEQLIKGILEGNAISENHVFSFEAHPANTSKEHLQTLFDLGFRRLSLGIQDFDSEVQRVINRKQSVEDVERVMQEARGMGYTSINFDLIYGLPLQSLESVANTVAVSLAMKPDRIAFYSYAHVPWLKKGQRHFTEKDLPVGSAKLELYKLGRRMMLGAGYADVGMDHFALPDDSLFLSAKNGALHRNFMGYTEQYTPLLIGLGVSSISDAWSAYAQNVKTVEEYYSLIERDELPVFRGHILTPSDEIIREYILELMCRDRVWLKNNSDSEIIKLRLQELMEDGLVDILRHEVRVTMKGKMFVRNICTAFDDYLHRQEQDSITRFSQAV